MDCYGSHQSVLVKYVMKTNGYVIELGCGDYSTPILHEICADRLLISADSNKEWASKFYKYITESHCVEWVYDWDKYIKWILGLDNISVIFIDHAPGERRQQDIITLANVSDYLVIHDTDADCYGYDFSSFKYKKTYVDYLPATTVVSNRYEL